MCIGRSAAPNARIATSTATSGMAASTRRGSSPPISSELEYFASLTPGRNVTSIFFGGGTPSLMRPATVSAILDAIAGHGASRSDAEITLEANPTSVEAENFAGYRSAGVNRLSLGVQALDDRSLKALGRQHTAGRSAGRARPRQAPFRPRVVRPDLCAGRADGVEWEEELRRALTMPPTTSRSISSPSRRARRSPRGTQPARCASLTASRRASSIASPRSSARRRGCRPTRFPIMRGRDRSRVTICCIGAATIMRGSAPERIAASPQRSEARAVGDQVAGSLAHASRSVRPRAWPARRS